MAPPRNGNEPSFSTQQSTRALRPTAASSSRAQPPPAAIHPPTKERKKKRNAVTSSVRPPATKVNQRRTYCERWTDNESPLHHAQRRRRQATHHLPVASLFWRPHTQLAELSKLVVAPPVDQHRVYSEIRNQRVLPDSLAFGMLKQPHSTAKIRNHSPGRQR